MQAYLDVPDFFSSVYLVDLSPSLCEVARKRFARLGWKVKVVCQDARNFRLEDHLEDHKATEALLECSFVDVDKRKKADLITMSYSLSMIPDYYNAVDSLSGLLAPLGLIGVVDFYVQSIVETAGRNYIGGSFNRHVNWLSRVIWRSWFDCDRVGLEGARRVRGCPCWTNAIFTNCAARTIWSIGSEPENLWMKGTICWEAFPITYSWAATANSLLRQPISSIA